MKPVMSSQMYIIDLAYAELYVPTKAYPSTHHRATYMHPVPPLHTLSQPVEPPPSLHPSINPKIKPLTRKNETPPITTFSNLIFCK